MNCEKWMLYAAGELNAQEKTAFEEHLSQCAACQANLKTDRAIQSALVPPAAPAQLVEAVFAKTTRRPGWWVHYRVALAAGVAGVLIAVAVGVGHFHTQQPFSHTQLVAYMSQTQQDDYATFLSDLDLFEKEF